MNDGTSGNLDLNEEDRLPWLEPASEEEYEDSVSLGRLLAFIVGGLLLLGLIVGGVYLLRNMFEQNSDATLIAAPDGDYKEPAEDPDAKTFKGEGDTSFAASEGIDRGGKIDPSRLPEAPVTADAKNVADTAKADAANAEAALNGKVIADKTEVPAPKPVPAEAAAPSLTGPMIQLGAYGSKTIAQDAWKRFAKRFDYLADLKHNVQPVTVNGKKFYRLRASVNGDAAALCGKLKVAGESCIVVR